MCFCLDNDVVTMVRWKMWKVNFSLLLWTLNSGFRDCCVLVQMCCCSGKCDGCHYGVVMHFCLDYDFAAMARWKMWNLYT